LMASITDRSASAPAIFPDTRMTSASEETTARAQMFHDATIVVTASIDAILAPGRW
jgi:hypothetical protein